MAIAFKPTCSLNAFALQYVNSQCQHDSLLIKLAAKLHLFIETAKSRWIILILAFLVGVRIFVAEYDARGVIKQKEGHKAFFYNWLIASCFHGYIGFK